MNDDPRAHIESLLAAAATRGERAISYCRGAFCLAMLARFVAIGGLRSEGVEAWRAAVAVPAVASAILVSALLLSRSRHRSLSKRELSLSVATDAVVCFAALLPNVLWPWEGYTGLLDTPDVATILLVAMTGGFRLFPSVTAVGGALHALVFATLTFLDLRISAAVMRYPAQDISIFAILLGGATALGVLAGARTLRLARAAAERALEVVRARDALAALLREHHDVRSFLSSATLNSDVMLRHLEKPEESPASLAQVAVDLREDLLEMHRLVNEVKERAYAELVSLEGPKPVEVGPVLERVIATVSRRFPAVRVMLEAAPDLSARVIGGAYGLERVVLNLLVNACEGDGTKAAANVAVRAARHGDRVLLEVVDDGPGFSSELLAAAPAARVSTKEDGSGLGLLLTSGLVEASGGRVSRHNLDERGARVAVELAASLARA